MGGEIMENRYTFQVTTPDGETLGSFKCDAHLSEKFLCTINQDIRKVVRNYKDALSAYTGAGEQQIAHLKEYKGIRESTNEMLEQMEKI